MDTLTHALSGALLARAIEPKAPRANQLPRRLRLWTCALAAAFPDSDIVLNLADSFTYITAHRGVTHSLVMLPLWASGLALLFSLVLRRRYSWKAFLGLCALGIGAHILGDLITAFGVMILAPYSTARFQFPTTFILDPYFTAILVAGLAASMYWRHKRAPAVVSLIVLVAYVGLQSILRERAVAAADAYVAANRLELAQTEAIPQPFSPFNWMLVVSQPESYRLAYISLVREEMPLQPPPDASLLRRLYASYLPVPQAAWKSVPRYGSVADAELVRAAWSADGLARYRRFAMFPALYRLDRGPERVCVWFNDLRFALPGRRMPFRYGVCRDSRNPDWKVHQLTDSSDGLELLEAIPD